MAKETVILIHGLWMMGAEMMLLKRRLQADGFHVLQFRYRMMAHSLEHNCARLASCIREHQGQPVNLVGHSLGGVLALQTLQRYTDLSVAKVICLGSPLVDSSAGRRLIRFAPGRAMVGKTLPEGVFDKPLQSWSGKQTVGVIAGTRPIGLGRLIIKLPRPHDGMVTLAETSLPGIDDHLTVNVSHAALVLSAAVARQCSWFLKHGQFRR
jgi:pimeloyl-ACP methyl ester carboxylesterase